MQLVPRVVLSQLKVLLGLVGLPVQTRTRKQPCLGQAGVEGPAKIQQHRGWTLEVTPW